MERRRKKKMVAHLCLVQRIGEDECITSCRSQSRLLGRDGKRTVTVWDVGDNGFSSSQNRRVRVVYSGDDERLVRLCIVTKREKKKKGWGIPRTGAGKLSQEDLYCRSTQEYSGNWRLGHAIYELAKGESDKRHAPHQRLGPPGEIISNCATAVPMRVLTSARRGKSIILKGEVARTKRREAVVAKREACGNTRTTLRPLCS